MPEITIFLEENSPPPKKKGNITIRFEEKRQIKKVAVQSPPSKEQMESSKL